MCVDKTLLNHLVGEREERRGHIEAECPGSLEIECAAERHKKKGGQQHEVKKKRVLQLRER